MLITESCAREQLKQLQQQAHKQRRSEQTCLVAGLWSLLAVVIIILLLAVVGLVTIIRGVSAFG